MTRHDAISASIPCGRDYPHWPVHRRDSESGMGWGHHLGLDHRGVALSGGDPRPLLARRDWLGHGHPAHRGSGAGRAHDGADEPDTHTTGLLHHSDRGSQYAATQYQHLLATHGSTASMSRTGNCWDKACVESVFGPLKRERIYHRQYRTRDEATQDIFEYIDVFYNRRRRHSTLGYHSPAEFEARMAVA